jgi:hypothetical protein
VTVPSLEEELAHARREQVLRKTPRVRRVVLRCYIFGAFGVLGLPPSVISLAEDLVGDPYGHRPTTGAIFSVLGTLLLVAQLWSSWRLVRAWARRDLRRVEAAVWRVELSWYGLFLLQMIIGGWLVANGAGLGVLPLAVVIVIAGFQIADCKKALETELPALGGEPTPTVRRG